MKEQARVLTLERDEHNATTLYRLEKGNRLQGEECERMFFLKIGRCALFAVLH